MERVEARHSLRVLYAINQCFSKVPDFSLFAASVDDPDLAKHLFDRAKTMTALDEQHEHAPSNGQGVF